MMGQAMNKTHLIAFVLTLAFLAVIVFGMGQCAPGPEKAVATLRTMGFTDIKVTDSHPYLPSWSGCSDSDRVAHDATATNPAGQRVSLVVCCGLVMKDCTVRAP